MTTDTGHEDRSPARRGLVVGLAAMLAVGVGVVALRSRGPIAVPGRDAGPVLRHRVERIELPPTITADGDTFGEAGTIDPPGNCFDSCAWASAYYTSTPSPAAMVPVVEHALREAGFEVEHDTCFSSCGLYAPDHSSGTTHYELSIVDGWYDGYVRIGTRADGTSGMEIVLALT